MLSRSESKYIQTLSHKKQRNAECLFIAEGPKLAEELLKAKAAIKKIYATEAWANNNVTSFSTTIVSEEELQKISNLQTANEVLLIVEMLETKGVLKFENIVTIALDGIQDPGNFGTIIRIADWFGIQQIVCSSDCVELYNPKVIQSTMGSFLRVNIVYDNLEQCLSIANVPIYGALLSGQDITKMDRLNQGIIVIGNESKGIRNNILPLITNKISIQKKGGAESLNAAVAAGIIVSHLV